MKCSSYITYVLMMSMFIPMISSPLTATTSAPTPRVGKVNFGLVGGGIFVLALEIFF